MKDGQRIALWVMKKQSIKKVKTSGLAGHMLASLLYVHGDASAQQTIQRLAAPYQNNICLLNGEGDFGSYTVPNSYAQPRYTDVARTKTLEDIMWADDELYTMIDNYDGSTKMPDTFLPIIPWVLVNGGNGTAMAYNTNFFPRDPKAIVKATLKILNDSDTPSRRLVPTYIPLDNAKGKFVEYNKDGKSKWEFSGKVEIKDSSTIIVRDLPVVSSVSYENYKINVLDKLEEDGAIKGYIDRTSKRYEFEVKFGRGQIKGWAEDDAINFLKLRREATETLIVLDPTGEHPVTYLYDETHKYPDPAMRLIADWVEWRLPFYKQRFEYKLNVAESELNYWSLIEACFKHELPAMLQNIQSKTELELCIQAIAERENISCDDDLASKISSLPSYRWTIEHRNNANDKIKHLNGEIKTFKSVIRSPKKQKDHFIADVEALGI